MTALKKSKTQQQKLHRAVRKLKQKAKAALASGNATAAQAIEAKAALLKKKPRLHAARRDQPLSD